MIKLNLILKNILGFIFFYLLIHFLLLVELDLIVNAKKYIASTEPPEATFEELYTGAQIDKVSMAKACSIDGGCIDNVALFASDINYYSVDLFDDFIKDNPSVEIVCLLSGGGEIDQATKMVSIIVDKKLKTCMADYYRLDKGVLIKASYCSSACNQVLLSSHQRNQIGALTSFSGHAAGRTRSLSFGNDKLEWLFQSSWNAENTGFLKALDYANTPDKQKHLEYFNIVKDINHLKEMKTLNLKEMKQYRIFSHQCEAATGCEKIEYE